MSLNINRSNYEQYLIDYLEGKLGKQDEASIQNFLLKNPDIAEDLEYLKLFKAIPDEPKKMFDKSRLIKSFNDIKDIDKQNFEEFCIAYYEGDLEPASEQKLKNHLENNPELRSLFDLYGHIRMESDPSIRYPYRRELKKTRIVPYRRIIYYTAAGIAAAVISIIVWFSIPGSRNYSTDQKSDVAELRMNQPGQESRQKEEIKLAQGIKSAIKTIDVIATHHVEPLAALDTSDTRQLDKIVLAALSPRPANLENNILMVAPEIQPIPNNNNAPVISIEKEVQDKPERNIRLNSLIPQHIDILFGAMNLGLKGFNTLTESQLALHTSTNDKGKLTEIGIDGENFEFFRKMQRNNQN
jgi:hypothetical protein